MQNFNKWKNLLFNTLAGINLYCNEKTTDSQSYIHRTEYCIITNSPSKFRSFYDKNLRDGIWYNNAIPTSRIFKKCFKTGYILSSQSRDDLIVALMGEGINYPSLLYITVEGVIFTSYTKQTKFLIYETSPKETFAFASFDDLDMFGYEIGSHYYITLGHHECDTEVVNKMK